MEYPKLNPGDRVILHEHEVVNGFKFWNANMKQYVGKETTIKADTASENQGIPCYTVDIDGGIHYWRVSSMTILSYNTTIVKREYGAICIKCHTPCPDALKIDKFVCWSCCH